MISVVQLQGNFPTTTHSLVTTTTTDAFPWALSSPLDAHVQ